MYLPIPPTHPLFQCCYSTKRLNGTSFVFQSVWIFYNLFSVLLLFLAYAKYSETKQSVLKQIIVVQLWACHDLLPYCTRFFFVTWMWRFRVSVPVFTSACCLKSAYFFTTNVYVYKGSLLQTFRCFHFCATFLLCCLKVALLRHKAFILPTSVSYVCWTRFVCTFCY